MNLRHPVIRFLTVYLAVALAILAPLSSFQQAAFAAGLKTVLVGGLVGGAALLALGALAGPAGAIGAAGCAGTGFLSALGGALGTAVAGVTGICAAMGTMAAGSLGTLGLMVGGATVGVLGFGLTPWLIAPALALGVGLFGYSWSKNRNGQTYDQSSKLPFTSSFFDAGSRLANRSESGSQDGQSSFMDRLRSITDRDRRDDSFFWNNRYVDGNGYVRQGNDFFSRLDQFFNGRNGGVADGTNVYSQRNASGTIVGTGTTVPTDRSGRVSTGLVGTTGRTGLLPGAPEATAPTGTSDELATAEAARKAAYEKLIQAMRSSTDAPAAPGASVLTSDEVQQAIRAYKEADRAVKEITGRLQANEKQ